MKKVEMKSKELTLNQMFKIINNDKNQVISSRSIQKKLLIYDYTLE